MGGNFGDGSEIHPLTGFDIGIVASATGSSLPGVLHAWTPAATAPRTSSSGATGRLDRWTRSNSPGEAFQPDEPAGHSLGPLTRTPNLPAPGILCSKLPWIAIIVAMGREPAERVGPELGAPKGRHNTAVMARYMPSVCVAAFRAPMSGALGSTGLLAALAATVATILSPVPGFRCNHRYAPETA
jgi:hypothetical protein